MIDLMRLPKVLISISFILAVGCGAPALPDYPGPGVSDPSRGRTVERDGIEATIDLFTDEERSEEFFGLDALASGVLILHVRVENASSGYTWLLERDRCKLIASASGSASPSGFETDMAAAETVTAVGAVAISVPLLILGNSMISRSTEIQRNFTEKELVNKTLSPGQEVQGFLYYRVDASLRSFRGEVQIPLTTTRTQETVTLSVPVEYERR